MVTFGMYFRIVNSLFFRFLVGLVFSHRPVKYDFNCSIMNEIAPIAFYR